MKLLEMMHVTICRVFQFKFKTLLTFCMPNSMPYILLAKDMGIIDLVCYSDSFHGINIIKGPSLKYHVYAVLIQDKRFN